MTRSTAAKSASNRWQPNLENIIQAGLLILVALMPFHAFLSTWLGTVLGHREIIQSWKEILLIILGGLTAALLVREPSRLAKLRHPAVLALGGFVALGLIITLIARPTLTTAIFGLKIDTEFLLAFALSLLVATPWFLRQLVQITLAAAAVVVGFGCLQVFVLPPNFLTYFGYGPDTVVPYQRLDAVTNSLRFAATLGGPNQLGTYLIIPISLVLAIMWRQRRWWLGIGLILAAVVLVNTHSRGAWVGALVALAVISFGILPRQARRIGLAAAGVSFGVIMALSPTLIQNSFVQHYFLHGEETYSSQRGSDFEHLVSLQNGTSALISEPLGHGFGTAGPSVFQTGTGRIIENYYLQLGYETGMLGMILFVAGIGLLGRELWRRSTNNPYALALAGALAGISVNALVLPVWTDSTGALVFWILAGAAIAGQIRAKEDGIVSSK